MHFIVIITTIKKKLWQCKLSTLRRVVLLMLSSVGFLCLCCEIIIKLQRPSSLSSATQTIRRSFAGFFVFLFANLSMALFFAFAVDVVACAFWLITLYGITWKMCRQPTYCFHCCSLAGFAKLCKRNMSTVCPALTSSFSLSPLPRSLPIRTNNENTM